MMSGYRRWLQGALLLSVIAGAASAFAADVPRQLKWADLVPKTMPAEPLRGKTFFGGSTPMPDGAPPPPPLPEGKFMSVKRYQPGSDRYDEMLQADGRLRPHWHTLIDQLENLSPEMLRRRANEVRDAIASDGVTYNVYADPKGANRPWELDLLPHLVSGEEWDFLERAVAQRARLMNGLLADIYGPQTLIAEGLLPPALVFEYQCATSPSFLPLERKA